MNETRNTQEQVGAAPLDMAAVGQTGPLELVKSCSRAAAGAELNVALAMRRLGDRVGDANRVGNAGFGHRLLGLLADQGIDHRCVATAP